MPARVGILVGMENDFPVAFAEHMRRHADISVELAKLEGASERLEPSYRVLIDRISHEIPFYRFYLKAAALAGTYVINDPFWWSADDKFFGYSLAARLGIAVPRTVMLPSKSYIPAIDPQRSLRNLTYPLPWDKIAGYVGFPAILKPAEGGGWKHVYRVNDLPELLATYDQTGTLVMVLQQFIDFEDYVRCICIGRRHVLPIRYDPRRRCYLGDESFMAPGLERQVMGGARALNEALGYDMNSVEFAVKDGVAYAIDFTNPAPDMYRESILPRNFEWCVEKMAELVTGIVREGRTMETTYPFLRALRARAGDGTAAGVGGEKRTT